MAKRDSFQFPKLYNLLKFSNHITAYVVHSSWHLSIIEKMLSGTLETLRKYNIANTEVVPVSGTFEIPQMISHIIKMNYNNMGSAENGEIKYILTIALGIVIQGETYHDRVISYSVANALQSIAITYPFVPIGFGILTVYNRQQAIERAFGKNNKGVEAALAALTQLDRIISLTLRMDSREQGRS